MEARTCERTSYNRFIRFVVFKKRNIGRQKDIAFVSRKKDGVVFGNEERAVLKDDFERVFEIVRRQRLERKWQLNVSKRLWNSLSINLDGVNTVESERNSDRTGCYVLWVNSCNAIPAERLIRYWHIKYASPCGRTTRNEYLIVTNKYVIEFRTESGG